MDKPSIYLSRAGDGSWNIDKLLDQSQSADLSFSGKISVNDGALTVKMPQGEWQLSAISGQVDFRDKPLMAVRMTARYADAPVKLSGKISRGKGTSLEVDAARFAIADLGPLVPAKWELKPVGGIITNGSMTLNIDQGELTYYGEGQMDDVAADVNELPVRHARGLVTFNEQSVHFFGITAEVYDQAVRLQGQITTITTTPVFDLTVAADSFDPTAVDPKIPVIGRVSFVANLSGTTAQPLLAGQVHLAEGVVTGYQLENATLGFTANQQKVTISQFSGDMFGGKVAAAGTIGLSDRAYQLSVQASQIDIATLPEVGSALSGRGDISLTLAGVDSLTAAAMTGSVKIAAGSAGGVPFSNMTGAFTKSGDNITVEYLSAQMEQGTIIAKGTINQGVLSLTAAGQKIPLAKLAAPVNGLVLTGDLDGEATVTGTLEDPCIDTRFTAYSGQAFYQPFTTATGRVTIDKREITLTAVKAQSGVTTHKVSGNIALNSGHELNLLIITRQARAENIAKLLMPDEKITGNVDNELTITGPADNFTATGKVKLTEGSFRGQLIAAAQGTYRRHEGVIELDTLMINSLNTTIMLTGTVGAAGELNLTAEAKDIDLAGLPFNYPYQVAGKINFAGKLTGTALSPEFSGQVTTSGLKLNKQDLEAVAGQVHVAGNQLDINEFQFSQKEGKFTFAGGINFASGKLYGSLKAAGGNVGSIMKILNMPTDGVDGQLDGQITLAGTEANPTIALTGTLTHGKLKNYSLDTMEVDIKLENKLVTINRFYAKQGEGILAISGTAALVGPLNLEIGGRGIEAGLLTAWFDSSFVTSGKLDFTAQVSGSSAMPHAAVSLAISGGGVANATFDSLYGLFVLDSNSIAVNQLLLIKGPYRASVYGSIPLAALNRQGWDTATANDQMDLKVRLDQANLSILPLLTKQVSWAAGATTGELTITGTLAQPMLYGGITVHNGTVKLAAFGDPIQKVGVDIQFEGDKINIKSFDGSMGSGSYRLTGTAALKGLNLEDYNILLVLDHLGINNKYFNGPLNGTLMLTTVGGIPSVSGKVTVEKTTANIPYIAEFTPSNLNIGLDVELDVGKKVRMYNSYLYDVFVDGQIKFAGTTRQPVITGQLNALHGTVNYLQTMFKIDDGRLDFTQFGSVIPVIKLEAETSLENTKITLDINGPVNAMDFRLTSEPAMSQQEIVSLLTLRSYQNKQTGPQLSRDNGIGRDEFVGLMNTGLQMRFMAEAEGILRGSLGLDDVRLVRGTPSYDLFGTSTWDSSNVDQNAYSMEFTKYVNERLQIGYSLGLDHNEHHMSFRYDLSRRFSITGTQDDQNKMRLGIETRIHF